MVKDVNFTSTIFIIILKFTEMIAKNDFVKQTIILLQYNYSNSTRSANKRLNRNND